MVKLNKRIIYNVRLKFQNFPRNMFNCYPIEQVVILIKLLRIFITKIKKKTLFLL